MRIAPSLPLGVSQVASRRNIPLRCTPAGGGSSGVGSTSTYAIGGTEAPATGRRPLTRPSGLLLRPLSGVCTPSAAAARRRQAPEICACGEKPHHRAPLHVCARGHEGGELDFSFRRRTVAGGLWPPTLNAFFRVCPRARSFRNTGFCRPLVEAQSRRVTASGNSSEVPLYGIVCP